MSVKSILKKIFRIQNDGVYRTFRIFGIKCRFKSPKLRLIRKIDFVSKQHAISLESRLRKEFDLKIKSLSEKKRQLERHCDNLESQIKKLTNENSALKKKLEIDTKDLRLRSFTISKVLSPRILNSNCTLCNSSDFVILGENPDFNNAVVVECENCGFVYNILPDNFDIGDYYKEEYREERHETITEKYVVFQDNRASAQFEFISRNIGEIKNKKILEIGCSIASLLKLEDDGTNMLIGYEPDLEMSAFAKERINGTIYQTSCVLSEIENESFDLIQLSHVFEHFENPVAAIQDLERKLVKGGHLFIEIPNENRGTVYKSLGMKGVGHFSFFNPRSFEYLVTHHTNLKILEQKTYTASLYNWIYGGTWELDKEIPNMDGMHYRVILEK